MDDCILAVGVALGSSHHVVGPRHNLVIGAGWYMTNSREEQL